MSPCKICELCVIVYTILNRLIMEYPLGIQSPLLKQKLSPKAAKAKAARDLAYAKTDDRREKKAEDQRRHRADPNGKGMDWDHEDQHWETASRNRGNDGNGTKSESGKHYKISKK